MEDQFLFIPRTLIDMDREPTFIAVFNGQEMEVYDSDV